MQGNKPTRKPDLCVGLSRYSLLMGGSINRNGRNNREEVQKKNRSVHSEHQY